MAAHWFGGRVDALRGIVSAFVGAQPAARVAATRRALLEGVGGLLDAVAARPGVLAAFAAHEGLVLDARGDLRLAEAGAAMTPLLALPAGRAATDLGLGDVHQVVVVAEQRKLALVFLDGIAVGIIAPADVALGDALA